MKQKVIKVNNEEELNKAAYYFGIYRAYVSNYPCYVSVDNYGHLDVFAIDLVETELLSFEIITLPEEKETITVRIVKADNDQWYRDRTGFGYEVKDVSPRTYEITNGACKGLGLLKSDCEIVENTLPKSATPQEKPYPKMMWVWDVRDKETDTVQRLVLGRFNNLYAAVLHANSEGDFRSSEPYDLDFYECAKDIEKVTLTKQEIADKFGVDVELIDIVE